VLQEKVSDQLRRKSDSTFLWVALVIEAFHDVLRVDILEVLEELLSGLTPQYDQMMKRIEAIQHLQRCLVILSIAIHAYRPLYLHEIHTIIAAGLRGGIPSLADLQSIIDMLAIRSI
jgi:hypothetical protein